jgi:hypothetical protein
MMLSTALTMMLDKSECVFLLNTPNSIDSIEVINNTKSPWIYLEIGMINLIRHRTPEEHRQKGILKKAFSESAQAIDISYRLNLDLLNKITDEDLTLWQLRRNFTNNSHPLDTLYKLRNIPVE